MSIENELNNLSTNISTAYDAVETKGGTIPTNKNMVNLPSAIESISAGGSFVGIPKAVNAQGVFGSVIEETVFSLPEDAKDVAQYTFQYAFSESTGLTNLDVHSIETLSYMRSFDHACYKCSNLSEINFSNLKEIKVNGTYVFNYAFQYCHSLSSISFPNLKIISGADAFTNAFTSCRNLQNVNFPELEQIQARECFFYGFAYCTNLSEVNFPKLSAVRGGYTLQRCFASCSNLQHIRFPSLSDVTGATSQFNNMLSGVTGCTVHFPASMQSVIGNWTDVTGGFGGTNTTVLFDL